MSSNKDNKKRSHEQANNYVDISVGQLGNSFKSKSDFINYWKTMLQVSY